MDSEQERKPVRGRARGRSRGPTPQPLGLQPSPPPSEGQEEPQVAVPVGEREALYHSMFTEEQRKSSGSTSPGGSGGNAAEAAGGSGGSDAGSGRGSRGSPTSGRGGVPRGGQHSPPAPQFATDYVSTRPANFIKKVINSNCPTRNLIANYYAMKLGPTFTMTLYAVKITPEVEDEWKIRKLVSSKRDELGPYIRTGFQLFVTRLITPELLTYHTQLQNDETNYTVSFDLKREVPLSDPLVLQFYNALVRQIQKGLGYELLGRHYFDHSQKVSFPNWKLDLWPGFQNSIRQQESGMMLNVESVWKVVKTDTILEMMKEISRKVGTRTGPAFERECKAQLLGLSIVTIYNRKPYKIDDILFDQTPSNTFPKKVRKITGVEGPDTVDVTFADYYMERYKTKVTLMSQPLLVSKPNKRDERRGYVKDILLVPEFCHPCGLSDDLRSNFRLMKDLASCLHMEPTKRVQTMNTFVQKLNGNDELRKGLKDWGVIVSRDPVTLAGRQLPPQDIGFGNGQTITGEEKADWTMGMRNVKMLSTVPLVKWAIIVTPRDSGNVGNLISTMQRVGNPLGYRIGQPQTFRVNGQGQQAYMEALTQAMTAFGGVLDMIFIVLPNNNLEMYAAVKKRCSRDFGIPSQCFLSKNLTNKGLMSICTKMVIQMNAKQGGEPWSVTNPLKTAMILGYDVHHAGLGGGMSVAAMTATTSVTLGRYYSTVQKLPADRQEIAPEVSKMFDKCLRAYAARNEGRLPARVMMYRDGVGEGQLRDVSETEVKALEEKLNAVYTELKQPLLAKFTYVVVNKRINTRLLEYNPGSGAARNPMPGLIVDDVVTRPERYDFFLISQIARQGCVSPTYYNVIYDKSGLTPDQLQSYTYRLCHLYYNWSGTVAVPGPCQNAHKYALQAGTALKGPVHRNLDHLLHFL